MLEACPITLRNANTFVRDHHRHLGGTARNGGKFAVAAVSDGVTVGVMIVGLPLSVSLMDGVTAEITRLCVRADAPRNTPSFLCGRAWRIWRTMGGERIVTYTLRQEAATSMRAAGFHDDAIVRPHRRWENRCDGRRRRSKAVYDVEKIRWIKAV